MKSKGIFPIVFAGILILLSISANAQDISITLDDTLTDNLTSEEDIKWYTFEMTDYGDAVLSIAGLQDHWDGYSSHWRCTVYADDKESVIASTDVRGYSANSGPNIISAPKLSAGTYYVQMTGVRYINPLLSTFTTDPYQINLIKFYPSTPVIYDNNAVQTFQHTHDILWAFDGTGFLKLNDGECFGALMRSNNGAIVPVLIGKDEASVEYMISSTGEKITAAGPWHDKSFGIDYYYSECRYIDKYTEKSVDTDSLPMLYVDTNSTLTAVEKIVNTLEEERYKAEHGETGYLLKKIKSMTGILGGIVVFILIVFFFNWIHGPSTDSEGGYSSSSSSSYNYDRNLHDELDATITAMRRSETYGPDWSGYDPEAPTDTHDIW